jgi:hypothetical protein
MAPIVPDIGEDRHVRRDLGWVLRRRLTTQRLSSAPLASATDVVRLLGCVQCQDHAMGTWALGVRTRDATYDGVLAEQRDGHFVRTHVLRPTWHFVAVEDLRWMLRVTSPKVESAMAARHRQFGLDAAAIGRGLDALPTVLAGTALTRKQIGALGHDRLPPAGEALGHLLLVAELRGLVCSGPPRRGEHTYTLVDAVVPPTRADDLDRDEAVRRLTERFFRGHGPATDRDLARWCGFTLAEVRAATEDLVDAGRLDSLALDDEVLWFDPARPSRPVAAAPAARLLWIYDEAVLTYRRTGFRRVGGTGWRADALRQVAGGVVLVDDRDVGLWTRRLARDVVEVTVRPEVRLTPAERAAVEAAAGRYAGFVERSLDLRLS